MNPRMPFFELCISKHKRRLTTSYPFSRGPNASTVPFDFKFGR